MAADMTKNENNKELLESSAAQKPSVTALESSALQRHEVSTKLNLEYPTPTKSKGSEAIYFRVPASIILDKDADNIRLSTFSFFSIRRDMENAVTFTLNGMAKWLGRKPDRHSGGINDRLSKSSTYLAGKNFISLSGKLGNASESDAVLNAGNISDECDNDMFAVIYLDELRKILSHDAKSADSTLLVFAWLRMRIMRRRNKLFPEEVVHKSHDRNVNERRIKNPEAYDCYCYEIAEELGLSARVVSKAIEILNELNLIYSEQLPKTNHNGQWQTNRTIFCNMYKRENGSLLDNGKEYYMREVENKKKKILRYAKATKKAKDNDK